MPNRRRAERRPGDREPAKTDAQAKQRFLKYLQQSLSTVHRTAIWLAVKPGSSWIAITNPQVIPLGLSAGGHIYLRSTLQFHYEDHPEFPKERKVATDEYAYTLSRDDLMKDEIVSWHWQPGSRADPHLHVGPAPGGPPKRHHIPSGRIAFEQVLRYAIDDCGVRPALKKAEALAQLDECLRRFSAYRTWE